MEYTAIFSRFENLFAGSGGAFLIAAIGVLGIVGARPVTLKTAGQTFVQIKTIFRHRGVLR